MDEIERKYWISFSRVPRIGRVRMAQLEERFGRLSRAWDASPGELRAAGLDAATVTACVAARERAGPDDELELLHRHGVDAITWHDDVYPRLLREIY